MLGYQKTLDARCRHGEPASVCYTCELQAEVAELRNKIAAFEQMDFVPLTASEP